MKLINWSRHSIQRLLAHSSTVNNDFHFRGLQLWPGIYVGWLDGRYNPDWRLMEDYKPIRRVDADTVLVAHPVYGAQTWTKARTRKVWICALSGKTIEHGEICYRPLSNQKSRWHRIKTQEIDKIL
jgi:hypothetical protein